ncbi:MAG: hypothetical protein ACE5HA_13590 [Anaerolineae bacterium]
MAGERVLSQVAVCPSEFELTTELAAESRRYPVWSAAGGGHLARVQLPGPAAPSCEQWVLAVRSLSSIL